MKTITRGVQKPVRTSVVEATLSSIKIPKDTGVLLVLDDHTRPNTAVIPMVISQILEEIHYDYGKLNILFATGMHRNMTYGEIVEKIGKRYATLIKTYQHNPFNAYNDFLLPLDDYYRISVSTVMPHSYMGFSGGAKILVPGLMNVKSAESFHKDRCKADHLMQLAYEGKFIDYTVQVVMDVYGTVTDLVVGPLTRSTHEAAVEKCKEVCRIILPESVDVAVLEPTHKRTDFLQAINSLTVLQGYNCVREGGTVAIWCNCPDGVGIHHLFAKGSPMFGFIDESPIFGPVLEHRNLAVITPCINKDNIQEYFRKPVGVFRSFDDFDLDAVQDEEKAIIIEGADCLIGEM